jgi:hypothetical protein
VFIFGHYVFEVSVIAAQGDVEIVTFVLISRAVEKEVGYGFLG